MLTPTDAIERTPAITELIAHSLRRRPGQIVVGGVHDAETAAMLEAWNTHRQGSAMTTHPGMPSNSESIKPSSGENAIHPKSRNPKMQSFLKSYLVPSSDNARIVNNAFGILAAAVICWAAFGMIYDAPANAIPTVEDVRNIVFGAFILIGSFHLMTVIIARSMKLVIKK
jgi:hypothetical protein